MIKKKSSKHRYTFWRLHIWKLDNIDLEHPMQLDFSVFIRCTHLQGGLFSVEGKCLNKQKRWKTQICSVGKGQIEKTAHLACMRGQFPISLILVNSTAVGGCLTVPRGVDDFTSSSNVQEQEGEAFG